MSPTEEILINLLDAIDWKPDDMPFDYYLDNARATAENCYILMFLSLAVERTLATIMLKNYEDFNNPSFLVITLPAQWAFGFIIQFSITNRKFFNGTERRDEGHFKHCTTLRA